MAIKWHQVRVRLQNSPLPSSIDLQVATNTQQARLWLQNQPLIRSFGLLTAMKWQQARGSKIGRALTALA